MWEVGRALLMEWGRIHARTQVQFLLDRGADAHAVDRDGKGAVELAVEIDAWDVLQLLYQHDSGP